MVRTAQGAPSSAEAAEGAPAEAKEPPPSPPPPGTSFFQAPHAADEAAPFRGGSGDDAAERAAVAALGGARGGGGSAERPRRRRRWCCIGGGGGESGESACATERATPTPGEDDGRLLTPRGGAHPTPPHASPSPGDDDVHAGDGDGAPWPRRFHYNPASSTHLNVRTAPSTDGALVGWGIRPGAEVVAHGASPCGNWLRLTPAKDEESSSSSGSQAWPTRSAPGDDDALWVLRRKHLADEARVCADEISRESSRRERDRCRPAIG
jgi:hypothetical protein